MFCWRQPQTLDSELPIRLQSRFSNQSIEILDDYFEPCEVHNKQIVFICKREQCRDKQDSMACNECILNHKDHNWITKEDFLTPNICNILTFRKAETDFILQETLKKILNRFHQMESQITSIFQSIKDQFDRSVNNIQEKYRFKIDSTIGSSRVILNKMKLEKLLNIYDIQQSKYEWIRIMQQNIVKISDQIHESVKNLLQDMMNIADAQKWQFKESHIDQLREFQKHLHKHDATDDRYHTFSNIDKHMNIRLNNNMDQATYVRSVPSRPFAVGSEYISHVHSNFGFQIMKMSSKAIFFDSTVVYLGICSSNIVKSFGYRRVNQFGKGAYLISSEGWAFHSTNQDFNNKEIVGWGFGQGDKILVQIKFDTDCTIKFTKKGRFFENSFEMPLKLNQFQLNRLKPCIGFDSDQGAVVKIFDIKELAIERNP